MEESAELFRALSSSGAAGEPGPELPSVLNALSCCTRTWASGRRSDSAEEAVAEFRSLARKSPARFMSDLSQALYNLSNRLGDIGLKDAAFSAIEERLASTVGWQANVPSCTCPTWRWRSTPNRIICSASVKRSRLGRLSRSPFRFTDHWPIGSPRSLRPIWHSLFTHSPTVWPVMETQRQASRFGGVNRSLSFGIRAQPRSVPGGSGQDPRRHADKLPPWIAAGPPSDSQRKQVPSIGHCRRSIPTRCCRLSRSRYQGFEALFLPGRAIQRRAPGQECVSIYSLLADKNPSLYAEPLAFEVGRLAALMRLAGLGDEAARLTNGVVRTAGARHEGSAGIVPGEKSRRPSSDDDPFPHKMTVARLVEGQLD